MSDLRSHFMIIDFKQSIQRDVLDPWLNVWQDARNKFGDKGIHAQMVTHRGDMKSPVNSLKLEFNCYSKWDKPEVYCATLEAFIKDTGRTMPENPIAKITYSRGFPGAIPSYSIEHLQ